MAVSKIPNYVQIKDAQKFRVMVHEGTMFTINGSQTTAPITGVEVTYAGNRKVVFGAILGGEHSLLGRPLFLRDIGSGLVGYDIS